MRTSGVTYDASRSPLPCLASRVVLSELLETPEDCGQKELFGGEVITAVIKSVWRQTFFHKHMMHFAMFLLEIIFTFGLAMCVKYDIETWQWDPLARFWGQSGNLKYSNTYRVSMDTCCFGIISVAIWFLWHEWLQLVGSLERKRYWDVPFKERLVNLIDILTQILALVVCGLYLFNYSHDGLGHARFENAPGFGEDTMRIDVFNTALAWLPSFLLFKLFTYFSGATDELAWMTIVLTRVFFDMVPFLCVTVPLLLFFAFSFWMLFANSYGGDDDVGFEDDTLVGFRGPPMMAMMTSTLMGIFGQFSTGGFSDSSEKVSTKILFIVFMLLVEVMALNTLIAIISDSFADVRANKQAEINLSYAKLLTEYMDCISARGFVTWCVSWAREHVLRCFYGCGLKCKLCRHREPVQPERWWNSDPATGYLHQVEMQGVWTHELKRSQKSQATPNFDAAKSADDTNRKLEDIECLITREVDSSVVVLASEINKMKHESELSIGKLVSEIGKIKEMMARQGNGSTQNLKSEIFEKIDEKTSELKNELQNGQAEAEPQEGWPSNLVVRGQFSVAPKK